MQSNSTLRPKTLNSKGKQTPMTVSKYNKTDGSQPILNKEDKHIEVGSYESVTVIINNNRSTASEQPVINC